MNSALNSANAYQNVSQAYQAYSNSQINQNPQTNQNLYGNPFASGTLYSSNIKLSVSDNQESDQQNYNLPAQYKIGDWKNQYTDQALNFIKGNKENTLQLRKRELKRQLKIKFFSRKNINKQIQQIALNLFYFPSIGLATQLQQKYNNEFSYEDLLFKSVVFRHGDLYKLQTAKLQAQHVMKNVRNWGRYYFDIVKLQKASFKKSGDASKRQYQIPQYQLIVQITPTQVSVQYKNKQMQPANFRDEVLKILAIDKIKKQTTQIYFKFIKQNSA